MSFEKRGVLSLWLFSDIHDSLEDSLLADSFGIDDYNEDLLEVGGSDTWDEMPLDHVLEPMSLSGSWMEDAVRAANLLGLTTCRRAFIILNFAYDPQAAGVELPDDPTFIGVLKFRR